MHQRFIAIVSMLAALLGSATRTASAVDFTWTGDASNDRFLNAGNWTPSSGPPDDDADRAIFNTAGTFTVPLGDVNVDSITNRSLEVRRGRVTLDLAFEAPVIGVRIPTIYNLESGGGLTTSVMIGTQSNVTAEAIIYGFAFSGNGTLNAQGALTLGTVADSNGRLTLTGVDWNGTSLVTIGNAGTGRVDLGAASRMTNASATLGFAADSHGTLRLVGDSAMFGPTTLTLSSGLLVGRQGTGSLTITDATLTNDGNASMAQVAGSTAVATVNDLGVWNANASLYVGGGSGGAGGVALLTVTGDGSTSTPGGRVAVADDVTIYPTGAITITGDGTLEVGGVLTTQPGSNLNLLQGGTLRLDANEFQPVADTFNWDHGTLHMTSNFDADAHPISVSPLGSTVLVNQLQALQVDGTLRVGTFDQGILDIGNGGVVTSGAAAGGGAQVGSVITTTGGAHVFLYNNADWINHGDLRVGGLPANGETAVLVFNGGKLVTDNTFVAAPNSTPLTADLFIGAGSSWISQNAAYLGGNQTNSGGAGTLEISDGGLFSVGTPQAHSIGELIVWGRFDVTMDDGTIMAKTLRVHGSITPDGPLSGDVTASNLLDVDGGTVELTPGNSLSVGDTVTIRRGGEVTSAISGNGNTQVSLTGAGSTWTAPTALVIGSSSAGVGRIRSLSVGTGSTVSLGSNAASVTAADSLTLDGGAINAASLDMGSHTLAGHGVINANFTTTGDILASGDLTLGNATSTAGFSTAGQLFTFASTVTLNDANAARLGSFTSLGFFGSPGTLIAPNGLIVDPGDSLTGSGDVDTLNDPTKPLTNNGTVAGATASARLGLSGFVNGTGTFDNVVFTGTFSPGLSSAIVNVGNVEYAETSRLILEIGGPTPGTQHDQLIHSGAALLDGTLDVDLLGGFIPSAEQTFTLMTYGSHTGQFSLLDFPPLPAGLTWKLDYGPDSLVLSTTSGKNLAGDIDLDGDVDRSDAALFAPYLGMTTPAVWSTGDFNGDQLTTLADLSLLQANFGTTLASPPASTAAVPEPATCLLLFVGLCALPFCCEARRRATYGAPLIGLAQRQMAKGEEL
jgi:hypothetical protein